MPSIQVKDVPSETHAVLRRRAAATIGLDRVWAETMAVNRPSRHVMLKLGMRHVRIDHRECDDPLPGSDRGEVVYEITGSDWASAR